MSEPFMGEVRMFSFGFAPSGWAQCNGQVLSVNQNMALYVIVGATYGGDGMNTFALPNLQGRVPVHPGTGYALGQSSGEAAHALTVAEMPAHAHAAAASSSGPDVPGPGSHYWASGAGSAPYANAADVPMAAAGVAPAGSGQPHENRPPYLVINFCIALVGVFPQRS